MKWRWRFGWNLTCPIFRWLLGVRVYGAEHVPGKGPILIASNHMSFLDPPLVGHAARRECFYLAKEELFGQSKFFRWLIKYFNALPIKRKKGFDLSLFKRVKKLLDKRQAIILFPEGTRSLKGKFLPFKTGVGMLALRYKVGVLPTYVKNTHRSFVEWLTRKARVEVYFAQPIYPEATSKDKQAYYYFSQRVEAEVHRLARIAHGGVWEEGKVKKIRKKVAGLKEAAMSPDKLTNPKNQSSRC